jgi:uncharacterized membrane protein
LAFGTCSSIILKLIDNRGFNHPMMQTAFMFFGEFICLTLAYGVEKHISVYDRRVKYLLIIPTLLDSIASTLVYVSFRNLDISTFQILQSMIIPFTGTLSIFFLRKKIIPFEIVGSFIVLIGTVVAGLSNVSSDSSESSQSGNIVLISSFLVVGSQLLSSIQMILEEYIYNLYDIGPLTAVGIEGFWGLVIMAVMSVIFYDEQKYNDTYHEIVYDKILLDLIISHIFLIGLSNYFGAKVTKVSSQTRVILGTLKTIIVSVISVYMGLESELSVGKIVGFLIITIGTFIYTNMIKIPLLNELYLRFFQNSDLEFEEIPV